MDILLRLNPAIGEKLMQAFEADGGYDRHNRTAWLGKLIEDALAGRGSRKTPATKIRAMRQEFARLMPVPQMTSAKPMTAKESKAAQARMADTGKPAKPFVSRANKADIGKRQDGGKKAVRGK